MADKGILLNTSMVQATLANRKNQTRRLNGLKEINACPDDWTLVDFSKDPELMRDHGEVKTFVKKGLIATFESNKGDYYQNIKCPWEPGDVLYVRETWYYENHMHDLTAGEPDLPGGRYSHRYIFKADCPDYPVDVGVGPQGWRPSIHMPKEAARLFLRVKDVRVERLRDITEEDAVAEGCTPLIDKRGVVVIAARGKFHALWDSLDVKPEYRWESNPWVWVPTFDWRLL